MRQMLIAALVFVTGAASATITLTAPRDGATVSLLRKGQSDYLNLPRDARHQKMDDASERVRLFRVGEASEPVVLSWQGSEGVVTLEIAPVGGPSEVFTLTNGETSARIANLALAQRYVWSVRTKDESATASFTTAGTPPRILRAEGVGNFRDVGGWKTTDGRRVRQNRVFRSAGLRFSARAVGKSMFAPKYEPGDQRITAAGIETLCDEFQIRTDLELRNNRECACMTGSILGSQVVWKHIPFVAYDFIDNMATGKEPFYDIFQCFTVKENYPILMHCSGGRDRTGTVVFLLNGLLGVGEEDLRRDWEFSLFADPSPKFSSARLERLMNYLKNLPGRTLQERIESYVRSCGITDKQIAAFRTIMLEPKPVK